MVSDAPSPDESDLTHADVAGTGRSAGAAGADAEQRAEARECMACRGTGKVISNLGGEHSERPCPWCQGTGVRQSGVDAQAAWRDAEHPRGSSGAVDETPPEAD